ncbi:MAG: cell envelope integrity protein CreD [Candidatus Caenarcaniphilales bacterium]|nr:cell envelope integrity protein CreD [Candidatus Caenarcaniphilales bacterium]
MNVEQPSTNVSARGNSLWNNKGTKLTLRLLVLGIIGLIMLIPLALVNQVIVERNQYRDEASESITQTWGSSQVIAPILLTIPFISQERDSKGNLVDTMKYRHILPEELDLKAKVKTETKYKGIFKRVVYVTDLQISGFFPPLQPHNNGYLKKILWDDSFVAVGINDLKTIQGQPKIKFADTTYNFEPKVNTSLVLSDGISTKINLTDKYSQQNKFTIDLQLRGTDSIKFIPVGRHSKISIQSSWLNPSFIGAFSPTSKEINDKGFSASWDISHLARGHVQDWIGSTEWLKEEIDKPDYIKEYEGNNKSAAQSVATGVSFLVAVDFYRSSLRAVKYGILFIALTFITYFMFEVISRIKIHPFQYLLVGIAVCIFYLLLLSLSEFIGFAWAYILASLANVGLITFYTKEITRKEKPNLYLYMLGVLLFLYSFLYVLLQLQDMSLLFGSVGLFIILGVIMYATKNIDWYSPKEE